MKLHVEVELGVDQAIKLLTESNGLSKEQGTELYGKTGGNIRCMATHPFTVDEAISVISGVLIEGSLESLLSEAQQMALFKGLNDNPMALTELANISWNSGDVLYFLKTRFGGRVMSDKETLMANIQSFLENEM